MQKLYLDRNFPKHKETPVAGGAGTRVSAHRSKNRAGFGYHQNSLILSAQPSEPHTFIGGTLESASKDSRLVHTYFICYLLLAAGPGERKRQRGRGNF